MGHVIVNSRSLEPALKPLTALVHLLILVTCSASFAQDADKLLTAHARDSRVKLESSVKDYLVVFNSHQDLDRARVGIPLASFADGAFNIAYDLSGRNVMAQWTFAQSSAYGNKINYRAYVGDSGVVSLAVSTRF